jgi:VanZ family protein
VSFRNTLMCWLLVVVWMLIIYSGSSDQHSAEHSSRFIAPVLKWAFPHLSEPALERAVFGIRKVAHLTEYAILGVLVWLALRKNGSKPGWSWRIAGAAVLIVLAYAITDEVHQLFVPTRQGTAIDVWIDTMGGICGMIVLWRSGRLRKWW